MKKFLFSLVISSMVLVGISSCTGCNKTNDDNGNVTPEAVTEPIVLNVENLK